MGTHTFLTFYLVNLISFNTHYNFYVNFSNILAHFMTPILNRVELRRCRGLHLDLAHLELQSSQPLE